MKNYNTDTIVAISTPPGRGGIGIIRISGESVITITPELLGQLPPPRYAKYLSFLNTDGSTLEKVIALFFPAPNSFTGEHVLEIHSHGGEIILDLLLEQILKKSTTIRLARPGEFTERAFLNGKIDLIQAEAISDIINATSYQAAKSASNTLQGTFSTKINIIIKKIINLRIHIESSIDFVEEEINILSYNDIQINLQNIIDDITQLYQSAQYGILLRDGLNIVIAGKPNAGKSSLFNKLVNIDRAIISAISGTTRDTLRESIQLNGINLHITDTAGLKKSGTNEIEILGIQRTWNSLNHADHILWVVDSNHHTNKTYTSMMNSIKKTLIKNNNTETPMTIIRNKSDLSLEAVGIKKIEKYTCITISALCNTGINLLKKYLFHNIYSNSKYSNFAENQGNFIARRRHLNALEKSLQYLSSAKVKLASKSNNNTIINELFAEDLKLTQYELNKIIGKSQSVSNNLLKKIFSTFCIGK